MGSTYLCDALGVAILYLFIATFLALIAVGIIIEIGLIVSVILEVAPRLQEFFNYIKLYRRMETIATEAQASLKSSAPIEDKVKHLTNLKQEIKHRSCPERAVPTVFNVVRLALAVTHLVDAGFSILAHLTKRLILQTLQTQLHSHTIKLFPVLLDRLGDTRERSRHRAIAAIKDFYTVSDDARKDVEQYIRDSVLTTKNPRAKQSAMQWILDVSPGRPAESKAAKSV